MASKMICFVPAYHRLLISRINSISKSCQISVQPLAPNSARNLRNLTSSHRDAHTHSKGQEYMSETSGDTAKPFNDGAEPHQWRNWKYDNGPDDRKYRVDTFASYGILVATIAMIAYYSIIDRHRRKAARESEQVDLFTKANPDRSSYKNHEAASNALRDLNRHTQNKQV